MSNDKTPIGTVTTAGPDYYHVKVRLRKGVIVKLDDIITLDMIEPYESDAVRKVAEYIKTHLSDAYYFDIKHAKEIVKLVHEAEDADE
jgi:hypothetical protein